MNSRKVSEIINPKMVIEGAGVRLRRSFGPNRRNLYDPFLLFDHFAFNDPKEGPPAGFPTHPHRGIETVTYMLEGNVRHRDSLGNIGTIGPGDVQWMTSGGGIMHEEMPRRGPNGIINGFQLWVNLPAADKMSQPRYQEVPAESIPIIKREGTRIRVAAGQFDEVHGPVKEIAVKPLYIDVTLNHETEIIIPVDTDHTGIAYVFEGGGVFGIDNDGVGDAVSSVSMVVFSDGDHIKIKAGKEAVRFMLMLGSPIKEPIVPYGPFVMNSEAEIQQAFEDLRAGTFVKS